MVLGYFACALRKSNRNFIMLSPLSGPAKPNSRGGFHPTSILRAIFFDHISFIAPLMAPLSSHCCSISAQGYWFSFCNVNLDPDQADLGQLTLMLIHIKAIWTTKSGSWLPKLTLSMETRSTVMINRFSHINHKKPKQKDEFTANFFQIRLCCCCRLI